MHLHRKLVAGALAAGFLASTTAHAEEKRIRRENLPPAVEKTVAEQSQGATIKRFSKEVEHGKTYYEAELTVDGHGRDISMAENGTIVEIEEEVALDSVPPAVNKALVKAAGSGKITKVESLSKNGRLVAYEAVVRSGTKQYEVRVGPDGKKLAHPK
jgi:uncharacterized membrane protein YkoI